MVRGRRRRPRRRRIRQLWRLYRPLADGPGGRRRRPRPRLQERAGPLRQRALLRLQRLRRRACRVGAVRRHCGGRIWGQRCFIRRRLGHGRRRPADRNRRHGPNLRMERPGLVSKGPRYFWPSGQRGIRVQSRFKRRRKSLRRDRRRKRKRLRRRSRIRIRRQLVPARGGHSRHDVQRRTRLCPRHGRHGRRLCRRRPRRRRRRRRRGQSIQLRL
mmetsp:Transcript_30153/g.103724  ORF Transcript_30153/g.103724 Transcript_30153/m.103724 type:complete len:215 (-) Transcript_30153:190-834(-)